MECATTSLEAAQHGTDPAARERWGLAWSGSSRALLCLAAMAVTSASTVAAQTAPRWAWELESRATVLVADAWQVMPEEVFLQWGGSRARERGTARHASVCDAAIATGGAP
jgi:hypothetical protein